VGYVVKIHLGETEVMTFKDKYPNKMKDAVMINTTDIIHTYILI
jgi:hypothetical protein